MHIEELLDEEVTALAGERYARKPRCGRRHGSNPVGLAGHACRFACFAMSVLRSYEACMANDLLLRRVL